MATTIIDLKYTTNLWYTSQLWYSNVLWFGGVVLNQNIIDLKKLV